MILDSIQNYSRYPFGPLWQQAFDFLKTCTPEMEDKKYILQQDDLYAGVDSYNTKPRSAAKLETHCKYMDIQVLIQGSETFEIYPKQELTVSDPYNPERDVTFYQIPAEYRARIMMTPGQFIVFFPEDAHMPCLMTGNDPQPVKKVVFKVKIACLG